jgi:DNA-binding transcriptional regulator YdaS (Cro superfamily)
MNIVERVIELLQPPTQAELARICGQKPQAITRWVKTGQIPAKHSTMLAIEQAVAYKVDRHEIRPDVFGASRKMTQQAPAQLPA